MAASKRKKPKSTVHAGKKVPNIERSTDGEKQIWRFDKIERSGKFRFDVTREDFDCKMVLEKIMAYSCRTWADIKRDTHDDGKSKHHYLVYDALSKEAKYWIGKRELLHDIDDIFSMALTNKCRIVGIRDNEYFYPVWFDPNHEFCPSSKKHT